jgi:phospholipid transport system substrate-binding protein
MLFASIGRRRWLQTAVAVAGAALFLPQADADPAAVTPIRELCDSLIGIMRAGKSTPFQQRYAMLAPVVERTFDLPAILQVSVGPNWSSMSADQKAALLEAFRRYTVASYVNNFDNYAGQHFDIQPDTRGLPNGEQIAETRIVSSSGETHELN